MEWASLRGWTLAHAYLSETGIATVFSPNNKPRNLTIFATTATDDNNDSDDDDRSDDKLNASRGSHC
jgi:hypothetical protein